MLMQLLLTRMNAIGQVLRRTTLEQRLHLLAIAHFILAIMTGVISALAMISAVAVSASMSGLLGETEAGAVSYYLYFGAGTSMACLALSAITAAAGWNLLSKHWRRFGLILELATMCLFPFGTILGAVVLVLLVSRPVREDVAMHREPINSQ
jgi:hypothetical protein